MKHYFDKDKAIEVLLYVTSQVEFVYHSAKIIYFANRYHLERYGRFVIDDKIIAMKNGPVLSNLYDMIKSIRGDNELYPCAKAVLSYFSERPSLDKLVPKRGFNPDYLSKSDIECLNLAIGKIKGMSFKTLEHFSHDDLYYTADLNDEISLEEVILHSQSPLELKDYLAG